MREPADCRRPPTLGAAASRAFGPAYDCSWLGQVIAECVVRQAPATQGASCTQPAPTLETASAAAPANPAAQLQDQGSCTAGCEDDPVLACARAIALDPAHPLGVPRHPVWSTLDPVLRASIAALTHEDPDQRATIAEALAMPFATKDLGEGEWSLGATRLGVGGAGGDAAQQHQGKERAAAAAVGDKAVAPPAEGFDQQAAVKVAAAAVRQHVDVHVDAAAPGGDSCERRS